MRVTVLTTSTVNTRLFYEPMPALGYATTIITYDAPNVAETLPFQVRDSNPDWVLYIGAIPGHHPHVPPIEILNQIGSRYKTVHFCCDGAEPGWWESILI